MAAPKENAIYRFSFRVSLGKDLKVVEKNLKRWQINLKDLFLDECDQYIYQLELGGETKEYHFQGHMKLKVKERCSTLLHRILQKSHRSWSITPCHDDNALKKYCMKKETRVQGPWADRKIYMGSDLPHQIQLYPWQRFVWDEISEDADCKNRTINWVYDPQGKQGKSTFCKKVWFEKRTPPLTYGVSGNLMNRLYESPDASVYLFNLTRSKPADIGKQDLYVALENLSDGIIINDKFKTAHKFIDRPHIWVFSNILPKFSALTGDRWKVWTYDYNLPPSQTKLIRWVPDPSKDKISADVDLSA